MVDYFEIGHVDNTHGLKGEMKVRNYSNNSKKFEELDHILVSNNGNYSEYKIENVRYQKDVVLLKLKGIDTIEEAEKLKGKYVYIEREFGNELQEGEHYVADLIGSEVYEADELIGTLEDIFTAGAADVYVIKRKGKNDLLLPALKSIILDTDVENKKIHVAIPDSLR